MPGDIISRSHARSNQSHEGPRNIYTTSAWREGLTTPIAASLLQTGLSSGLFADCAAAAAAATAVT